MFSVICSVEYFNNNFVLWEISDFINGRVPVILLPFYSPFFYYCSIFLANLLSLPAM